MFVLAPVLINMAEFEALEAFKPSSKDGREIQPILIALFSGFETKISTMFSDLKTEVMKVLNENSAAVTEMKKEVSSLKQRVAQLEERIEDNESYERRDTLIISGQAVPPAHPGENTKNVTCSLLREKVNIEVSPGDISACHRLDRPNSRNRTNRPRIIVKFCRRDLRNDVKSAARVSKPDNLYINDSLTPLQQTISYVLRVAKREFPEIISGFSTQDGKNFVWVKPPNPSASGARDLRLNVSSHDRLSTFCTRSLQKPVSHFIDNWPH